ncbi:MAG: diaminopimelate dehydrogenase [Defluviitaleaceae bacterium]|nr:diaminopimelate dehydrogenase [Defluviitaleaceae bacterium]MCL2239223.1 diaminopimelate dehydrogenase [Defluviitaleaceae bacterium]
MIKVAIVGYGNIGRAVYEALEAAPDMEIPGVVIRDRSKAGEKGVPRGLAVAEDIAALGAVDVAMLCVPSRSVPDVAESLLTRGIHTVDSYDIHKEEMLALYNKLDQAGKKYNAVAVIGAGWDPGIDTMMRGIFEFSAPRGITYTNFGPGMSMGHTVAVKSIAGVRKALSVTIPTGAGVHRRMVYIEVEAGHDFGAICAGIKNDPYFVHDETHVMQVEDVAALQDVGHGVRMERKGVAGQSDNQLFSFDMRINGPAVTAQVMVAAARASVRQQPGCYTLLDIPVAYMLPGKREDLVRRLV